MKYILSIDQSTASTKCLLFDEEARPVIRKDIKHRQIVNSKGWVEHDAQEIYSNIIKGVREILSDGRFSGDDIVAAAISNPSEPTVVWNMDTGKPVSNAIVWQCGRAASICEEIKGEADLVKQRSGMNLSPYFSAAKMAWIMRNIRPEGKHLAASTMDSWIIYRLSGGKVFATEPSNASRTQLMDIASGTWDSDLLALFSLDKAMMPEILDSDALFTETDFEGTLPHPIPLHAVLGDSQAALYGHGCTEKGGIKVTHGTGSSIMMNIGSDPISSKDLVTSIAWRLGGRLSYVMEGNINYCGALTSWAVEELGILPSAKEAGRIASATSVPDGFYIVPAFTGLGAPYWQSRARALICGMDRSVGRNEIIRGTEEAIGYQIADIIRLIEEESGLPVPYINADGGPTHDSFLMQFESDVSGKEIRLSGIEELSAAGAAIAAGRAIGLYDGRPYTAVSGIYTPQIGDDDRTRMLRGWHNAISLARIYSEMNA